MSAPAADLVAAARFELESRERNYPALVASGKLTADEATIDFQAWHCIAGFIATGRFQACDAGAVDGLTVVGWALAEAAADRAVANTAQAQAGAKGDDAKLQRLAGRLEALQLIAARVRRQHALVDSINRRFREDRQQRAA